jgi:hypothetical protein
MPIQPGERDPSGNGRLLSVLRLRGVGLQTSRHAQAQHFKIENHSVTQEIGPSKLQINNGSVTPGLRIGIRIGSVFNRVRGSGSRRETMTHKSRK